MAPAVRRQKFTFFRQLVIISNLSCVLGQSYLKLMIHTPSEYHLLGTFLPSKSGIQEQNQPRSILLICNSCDAYYSSSVTSASDVAHLKYFFHRRKQKKKKKTTGYYMIEFPCLSFINPIVKTLQKPQKKASLLLPKIEKIALHSFSFLV